ncbi:unnamed protein product [Prorocentrum cordatum]|uniref:TerD domain-containing protein n=1 Tax=Prorocentrum cordatum TaxID=2364126 RepID=A0ABN9X236_9DINO|nr:unnamed protein product [Polarella glacialis]
MEKGEVFALPESSSVKRVFAGLGWDVADGAEVDLDVSAVCLSKDGQELGAVFFGNTSEFGLEHSGDDNLDGEGDGDDEVISADLERMDPRVDQIVFVVNIYSNGVTFDQVSNAYCRIFDGSNNELARYLLREGRNERGLIISRLFREPGDRWGFQAVGQFCRGKTWKDAIPEVVALVKKPATAFQVRSDTSMSLGGPPTASFQPSAPPASPRPHGEAAALAGPRCRPCPRRPLAARRTPTAP